MGSGQRLFLHRISKVALLLFLTQIGYSGGLVRSYLVRVRENSSPRSPGSKLSIARLKTEGVRNLSILDAYMDPGSGQKNKLYGPRSPGSSRVKSIEKFWFISAARIKCSVQTAEDLKKLPKVLEVVPEEMISLSIPDPPGRSRPSRWFGGLNLPLIHAAGHQGKMVRVGLIDTGIIPHRIFTNRIDRYQDFTTQPFQEMQDPEGHGTHVAGILAGQGSEAGEAGVAPGARLIVARVLERIFSQGDRDAVSERVHGLASRVLRAMQWMLDPDGDPSTDDYPRIINNSWGFPTDQPLSRGFFTAALRRWRDLGIIPLFAAGNEGRKGKDSIRFPGDSTEVITIGALQDKNRAGFSSQGAEALQKPDFSAPGFRVFSLKVYKGQPVFGYLSGTSMATAALSGLVALMLEIDPFMTYEEVYRILKSSSEDLQTEGFDFETGWGAPDFQKTLHHTRKHLFKKANLSGNKGLDYFLEFSRQVKDRPDSWARKALIQIELSLMDSLEDAHLGQDPKKIPEFLERLEVYIQNHARFFLPLKWRLDKRLRFLRHGS